MIDEGADVHACDDQGQNVMHEIARHHGAEICYFFLDYKVNINLGKKVFFTLCDTVDNFWGLRLKNTAVFLGD